MFSPWGIPDCKCQLGCECPDGAIGSWVSSGVPWSLRIWHPASWTSVRTARLFLGCSFLHTGLSEETGRAACGVRWEIQGQAHEITQPLLGPVKRGYQLREELRGPVCTRPWFHPQHRKGGREESRQTLGTRVTPRAAHVGHRLCCELSNPGPLPPPGHRYSRKPIFLGLLQSGDAPNRKVQSLGDK